MEIAAWGAANSESSIYFKLSPYASTRSKDRQVLFSRISADRVWYTPQVCRDFALKDELHVNRIGNLHLRWLRILSNQSSRSGPHKIVVPVPLGEDLTQRLRNV